MREKLKSAYYYIQRILGKDKSLLDKIKREDLVVVLNLHQISPNPNPYWSPLHPKVFDGLMEFCRENFEVVLFRELNDVQSDKPLAVISFDDGYYDFIEYAEPVLHKHGLQANMNIIPQCVKSGEPMWNIRLYDFLNSAPKSLVNEIALPGFDYRLKDEKTESKIQYGLKISSFLKKRPRSEREELWRSLEKLIGQTDFPGTRMMNAREIRGIAERHEIGVHSFTHESMEFETDDFFNEDLQMCLDYFRNELKLPLSIYAFPNGSYREHQIQVLRNNGINKILLVGEKYATPSDDVLPRFTIYGPSVVEARFQALGINQN